MIILCIVWMFVWPVKSLAYILHTKCHIASTICTVSVTHSTTHNLYINEQQYVKFSRVICYWDMKNTIPVKSWTFTRHTLWYKNKLLPGWNSHSRSKFYVALLCKIIQYYTVKFHMVLQNEEINVLSPGVVWFLWRIQVASFCLKFVLKTLKLLRRTNCHLA